VLLLENLPLGIAIVAGAYIWYRTGFRTPKALGLSAHTPRQILIAFGWILLLGITAKSVGGGLFGDGRVSIGKRYAYRTREPLLFWGEIAGEMLLVGGTGVVLIALGRRQAREL
jgi:hypothetical protein